MKIPLQPERVYSVGAAGFWLQRWPDAEKKREQRIFAAIERKLRRNALDLSREETRRTLGWELEGQLGGDGAIH